MIKKYIKINAPFPANFKTKLEVELFKPHHYWRLDILCRSHYSQKY